MPPRGDERAVYEGERRRAAARAIAGAGVGRRDAGPSDSSARERRAAAAGLPPAGAGVSTTAAGVTLGVGVAVLGVRVLVLRGWIVRTRPPVRACPSDRRRRIRCCHL